MLLIKDLTQKDIGKKYNIFVFWNDYNFDMSTIRVISRKCDRPFDIFKEEFTFTKVRTDPNFPNKTISIVDFPVEFTTQLGESSICMNKDIEIVEVK